MAGKINNEEFIKSTLIKFFDGNFIKDQNFLKKCMTLSSNITSFILKNGNLNAYRKLSSFLEEICNLAKERCDASDDYFVEFLKQLNNYYVLARFTVNFFKVMDLDFIKYKICKNIKGSENNIYYISDTFDYNWKKVMYLENVKFLNNKLIQFINEYRENLHTLAYTKECITNIVKSISFDDPEFVIFKENTIDNFLTDSAKYYDVYLKQFLANNSPFLFLKRIKQIINENECIFEVIKNEKIIYESETIDDRITITRKVIIGDVYNSIIDFYHDIFFINNYKDIHDQTLSAMILDDQDFDVVSITHYFYSYNGMIVEYAKLLSNIFWENVQPFINNYDSIIKEPICMYEKLIQYYQKYFVKLIEYVNVESDKIVINNSFSVKMRELINYNFKSSNIAIMLTEVTNLMLVNNGLFDKNIDSIDIDTHVNNICILLQFIEDKDYFMNFYKKSLSKRLLTENFNEDNEKLFLSRFKMIFGNEFIIKVQNMIDDISNCIPMNEEFSNLIVNKKNIIKNVSYKILKNGIWPIKVGEFKFKPHPKFLNTLAMFEYYYNEKFNGRKLLWLDDFSDAIIISNFGTRKCELICNYIQANIMLTINDIKQGPGSKSQPIISKEGIMQALQITDNKLFDFNIKPLYKKGVILTTLKNDPEGIIPISTKFTINGKFNPSRAKISLKYENNALVENKKDESEEIKHINESRNFVVQAAIIKILKTRKEIYHNELIIETIKIITQKFKPSTNDVKKNIDILMEKEYLERIDIKKIQDEEIRNMEIEKIKVNGGAKYSYIA